MKYKRRTNKPYSYYREFKEYCFSILGNICVKCGSKENLQIDHIDYKAKSFNISSKWSSKTLEEVNQELAKCQTLCSKCHLEKTKPEIREISGRQTITHGSFYAWMKKKCNCLVCSNARDTFNTNRRFVRRH